MREARIAPSLLAADFGAFADAARACERAGVEVLHFDIMDGHFVPNLTFGAALVRALRPLSTATFDVHLMVDRPDDFLAEMCAAGADILTVHAEACTHLQRTLATIRQLGAKAGLALNPATPLSALDYVLDDVDLVLVMSVNPGFGGQAFIPESLRKIADVRRRVDGARDAVEIEVDGGIGPANIRSVAEAGATLLVAGSSVFGDDGGVANGLRLLREALEDP